jgi:hypothetical protein
MLLGIDWVVVEDSRRKAKLVVSLYVVGFCFMYNIHDVHLPIFFLFPEKKNGYR